MIFFRWWSCTLFSSQFCGLAAFGLQISAAGVLPEKCVLVRLSVAFFCASLVGPERQAQSGKKLCFRALPVQKARKHARLRPSMSPFALFQGKEEYTPPPWHPAFLGLSPDPEVTERKKLMVYTIFLGKQGKGVYTIGPWHRSGKKGVHHRGLRPGKGKKRRVSTVVASSPKSAQTCKIASKHVSEMGQIRFRTPNSVSFLAPHRVPGRGLSEFLSAYYLCAKANSPSFSQNSPSLP